MTIKGANWCAVCYGNILRSQVLEQYIKYHSSIHDININICSAGVAGKDEFPDKEKLYKEIYDEMRTRGIPCSLKRNPWDSEVEARIASSDLIICADNHVKKTVIERMGNRLDANCIFTFYEAISEGEAEFEDTYDYENNRQDPVRFKNAFDELERIALKLINIYKNS